MNSTQRESLPATHKRLISHPKFQMLVNKFPSWDISGLSLSFDCVSFPKMFHCIVLQIRDRIVNLKKKCELSEAFSYLKRYKSVKNVINPCTSSAQFSKSCLRSVDTLFHIWFASKLKILMFAYCAVFSIFLG